MVIELKVCRKIILVSLSFFLFDVLLIAIILGPETAIFNTLESLESDSLIQLIIFGLFIIFITFIIAPILMLIGMINLSLKVKRTRFQTSTIIGSIMWIILLIVIIYLIITISHLNTIPASLHFVSLMIWGHTSIILPLYSSMRKVAFFMMISLIILLPAISLYFIYNNPTDEIAAASLSVASLVIFIFQISLYITHLKKIEKEINKPVEVIPITDHS